jgi:hypothetical protein
VLAAGETALLGTGYVTTPWANILDIGEKGFQDFYDFLMRTVPLMSKKSDLGQDI